MKIKLLCIALISLSVAIVRADTATVSGTILSVTPAMITIQKDAEVWTIRRTAHTTVTGQLTTGSMVTVTFDSADSQKKEAPAGGTPTPAN
jgi:hypothetical protein